MSHHRNPRALLTPVMRQVLERLARAGRAPLHALTPEQARAAYEAGAGVLELAPHKLARVEDLHFTARDGHPLPARLYAPEHPALDRPALPVLLYLHGGGFTVGSITTHDVLCRHLSHLAHCAVVSVDYRLAPQHQFPTAAFDAWDSLNALLAQAPALGLDGARLAHKRAVIEAALARHAGARSPLAALAALGGFEIAMLVGAIEAAVARGCVVVIDGYVVTAALLVAWRRDPRVRSGCVFAHLSAEPGHRHALAALDGRPLLDLGLRLGEGSGAALAMPLLRAAARMLTEMASFEQAGVSRATGA